MKQTVKSSGKNKVILNQKDIIVQILQEKPEILGDLKEQNALRLLRYAIDQIARKIADVEKGVVKVSGLGNFHVQQVVGEQDGEKTTVRRVIFKAITPKK